jgi:hypothetical protein
MVVMLNRHKVVNGSGFSILNSDLISDFVDQYSIIQIKTLIIPHRHQCIPGEVSLFLSLTPPAASLPHPAPIPGSTS